MKNKNLLIILIGLLFIACSPQKQEIPNILWITCEDISPAWGCYGDTQATTPHIDRLAAAGYVYTQAFSNAPICAPARSTLITGMYATSLGTQNLRSVIPVPDDLRILPELLREKGYFTSNNAKTDYNFSAEGRWDENSNKAHWRNRPDGSPFFSVFNFGITHEGHANTDKKEDTQSLETLHDPAQMEIPPYFPDTEEFRKIMAHQYDLITVFDQEVGKLLKQLEEDGLTENTIVFVFSDHGYGLPRYKRWLYNTGLQVPFVLHIPEKYKERFPRLTQQSVNDMVGFVDFAPSVLEIAGIKQPTNMEGQSFFNSSTPKSYIFGYRDRADDVYDMSRSVYDGRYLYIRNFMPHKPYIQNAVIFNKGKRSFDELFRVRELGKLSRETEKMFTSKPVEELYDLHTDPHELNNLINEPSQKNRIAKLRAKVKDHMLKTHDTGLMNEGDMMERAGNHSVLEMARKQGGFDIAQALEAADRVGKLENPRQIAPFLKQEDAAVRFWALTALDAYKGDLSIMKKEIQASLQDPSLPNRTLAAEILIKRWESSEGLEVLSEALKTQEEPMLLQAAISLRNIGSQAKPLIKMINQEVYPNISGEIWGRYKNWMYPMFIGMALDQSLENCQK